MYGPYEKEIGGVERGHIRRKTKEEKKYHDALDEHLPHFHDDYALFRKIVKAIYPEAKETDIQKYGVIISSDGRRGKGFGIWIEGYGKHAEEVPAWEYPKLSLFYRLLTALTAMKHNLDIENAYRALSVELPKRLGHRVPKPEEIQEVEKTINKLVREGMLPERAKEDVIDLAKELSQIVYEAFPNKESVLEHRERIKKQIRRDESWGVKDKGLGDYWYEVVLEDVLKKHSKNIAEIMRREAAQQPTPTTVPTKTITQKIPSEVEEAFKTLKGMGVDLKLETGNVAERKAKIYAWMVQNGLIHVEQEEEKVRIVPTKKMHQLIAKHGKAAGAILKWAAEEGVGLEHVEPVGRIVSALEELRQETKRENTKLAEALWRVMKRKTAVKELNLLVSGLISPKDLSQLWGIDFRELLKNEKLRSALLTAVEGAEKSGLASPEVPAEWVPFLEKLKANSITEKDLRSALNLATVGRMTFSALESVAIRGLPTEAEEIEKLLLGVLKKTPDFLPFDAEVTEELEEELRELATVLALMKDESYIERLEENIAPIIEKIPETRKVGLFRRDSPRRKVEDFVAVLMSGKLTGEEAEEKAEELRDYLREYLSEEEIAELIEVITLPFTAKALLETYETAEDFLFAYAHARAARYLTIEGHLMEALKGGSYEGLHDSLVRTLASMPSLRPRRVTLIGLGKTRKLLEGL
ncbi:hypothetical protein E3E36_08060 [Thermococcus sp. M36]|uniref:hypothetical protein n=1 Tax=Thermococcus sp. M36 TaxID=1638261 RepID=UPI001438DF58|nr:hypothetical protein [Thermococcus sp. M36]NJE06092.1 hypothetical protein [Thermococcus sp. M36]